MTKQEISQKRVKDLYYKNRERAFHTLKRVAKNTDELREYRKKYDIKNRLMVEYMEF